MGWETLGDIKRENAAAEEAAASRAPMACPHCGEVLQVRGNVRNCPMGDFRWEA